MKYLAIVILLLASYCKGASQSIQGQIKTEKTSAVIKGMSFFWKTDSLAANGYRSCSYKRIVNSKLDSINVDFLVLNLGKPNSISQSNHGTEYIYYCYDSKKIPKERNSPFECVYISFLFKKNSSFVTNIEDGVMDY